MRWKEDVRYRTKRTMKDKKVIDAVCNAAILIILLGILLCVLADSSAGMIVAFTMIEIGCIVCIVGGYVHERMFPIKVQLNMDQQDREDIKSGKYADMYEPVYLFMDYLKDNSCTVDELIQIMKDAADHEMLLDMVYLNYKVSAGKSEVQSKKQVEDIIEKASRRKAG